MKAWSPPTHHVLTRFRERSCEGERGQLEDVVNNHEDTSRQPEVLGGAATGVERAAPGNGEENHRHGNNHGGEGLGDDQAISWRDAEAGWGAVPAQRFSGRAQKCHTGGRVRRPQQTWLLVFGQIQFAIYLFWDGAGGVGDCLFRDACGRYTIGTVDASFKPTETGPRRVSLLPNDGTTSWVLVQIFSRRGRALNGECVREEVFCPINVPNISTITFSRVLCTCITFVAAVPVIVFAVVFKVHPTASVVLTVPVRGDGGGDRENPNYPAQTHRDPERLVASDRVEAL